jgi:hypothetical protein
LREQTWIIFYNAIWWTVQGHVRIHFTAGCVRGEIGSAFGFSYTLCDTGVFRCILNQLPVSSKRLKKRKLLVLVSCFLLHSCHLRPFNADACTELGTRNIRYWESVGFLKLSHFPTASLCVSKTNCILPIVYYVLYYHTI